MKKLNKFLNHPILPWVIVILLTLILIIKSIKPDPRPIQPPKDNRIDSLSHIVDSLNIEYNKLKHNYDSAQANARVEIQKIYIQNAKDVSNIRSYTINQRDSMWSTLNP
jgi:hypothetical protein